MTSSPDRIPTFRPSVVLANRQNFDVSVTLLWHEDTNSASVHVRDYRTAEEFELVVEDDMNPLDVFKHPYAYAAWRGVDFQTDLDLREAA
jgi:hypothetical protein